jgi:hypothetical protein
MPTPVRETVLAAAAAALGSIVGVTVTRNDDRPLKPGRINMIDGGHDQDKDAGPYGVAEIDLRLIVECCAGAATAAGIGAAISLLAAEARRAILNDAALGALVVDRWHTGMSDPELLGDEGRAPTAAFTLQFMLRVWEKPLDPYTLGP